MHAFVHKCREGHKSEAGGVSDVRRAVNHSADATRRDGAGAGGRQSGDSRATPRDARVQRPPRRSP